MGNLFKPKREFYNDDRVSKSETYFNTSFRWVVRTKNFTIQAKPFGTSYLTYSHYFYLNIDLTNESYW